MAGAGANEGNGALEEDMLTGELRGNLRLFLLALKNEIFCDNVR